MTVEFGPEKRILTLAARGLDMARAGENFFKNRLTTLDRRNGYGDARLVSVGLIDN